MDVDMAGYPMLLFLITTTKQGLERSVTLSDTGRGRLGRTRSVATEARLSRPRRLLTANVQHSDSHTRSQGGLRSEEHTSELQSLMRISYAVFCLKKKTRHKNHS